MSCKSSMMFTVFSLMLLTTLVFTAISKNTYAQDSTGMDIRINHSLTVYDTGMVILSDTVTLSRKANQTPPKAFDNFQLGFPINYEPNIFQVWAYQGQNTNQRLNVDLDTGLGNQGFYGVKVNFTPAVDLNQISPFTFTVVHEFSDLIIEKQIGSTYTYIVSFPVFPSLTQQATSCTTTVVLPSSATFTGSSQQFNNTASETYTATKESLEPFTFQPGTMQFTADSTFNLLDIREVDREITLGDLDTLLVKDFYAVSTNRTSAATSSIPTFLPANATNITAEDDIGNKLTVTTANARNAIKATITLKAPIPQSQTAYIIVSFNLPWANHVTQNGLGNYVFSLKLFEPMNITLRRLNVTVNLPEGSKYQSSDYAVQFNLIQSGIYSQTPFFTVSNVSVSQDLNVALGFQYVIFWSSFRPTLWISALVAIIAAIGLAWQTMRAAAPTTVSVPTTLPIRAEELRNYVKLYEEQMKLARERESLENQARKGKIPRRLYRVRTRTLDSRLSLLSRDLAGLRERIRAAGGRYSDMMRQIEIANAEQQSVEADIQRTEARYKRGEISAVVYHKLLEDNLKRKDRAQTNIDGILLRLREETG